MTQRAEKGSVGMETAASAPQPGRTLPRDLGRRIRQARQERGLTLAQLGGSDLSRGFLSSVELGRTSISLKALSLVAERLQLPLTYFLAGEAESTGAANDLSIELAEAALRRQQPADALRLLPEPAPGDALRARILWLRGWALTDLGRPREAIPVLQEALPLAETAGEHRFLIQVLYTLAMALYTASNLDEALGYFRRAHEHALHDSADQALLGRITVCIGHLLYGRGSHDAALAQYARARELFTAIDDFDNLAGVYSGLSRVHQHQGDMQAAIRYSRLCLGILEARHNERQAAYELNNIAARYNERGDTEQALTTARDAVARAHGANAGDVESLARSTLADILLHLGQLEDATVEAEAARRVAADERDQGYIDATVVLAKVADQRGDHARADQLYRQSLEALETVGHLARYADVALAYGETLRARGDTSAAMEYAFAAAKALSARRA